MHPPTPWSRRAEFAATTAFWVLLTVLLLVRRSMGPTGFVGLTPSAVVATVAEYGVWIALTPIVFALARRMPLEREHGSRIVVLIVAGLALAAAVETVRTVFFVSLVDIGLLEQLPGPRFGRPQGASPVLRTELMRSVLRFQFIDEFVIYSGVLATGYARGYALRAFDRETESTRLQAEAAVLEADRARLEGQLTDARLSALRMQLNPHFLFNALNAVSAYIEREPERAQTMLAQLGGLLRRVLDSSAQPEVPLTEELALLRDYLAIQKARFGDTLTIEEHVDPDALDALVPALVLQPLAENAVEHGVSRLVGQPGRIAIGARLESTGSERQLVLTVTDNGPGLDNAGPKGTGVGLANTRDRLGTLYRDDAALTLDAHPTGGTVVTVTLPYRSARNASRPAHV